MQLFQLCGEGPWVANAQVLLICGCTSVASASVASGSLHTWVDG